MSTKQPDMPQPTAILGKFKQLEETRKAQLAELDEKRKTLIGEAKTALLQAVTVVHGVCMEIPEDERAGLFKDESYSKLLKDLGLKVTTKTIRRKSNKTNGDGSSKGGVRHPDFTDKVVEDYIRENPNQTVGQVEKFLMSTHGVTKPTVTKRIDSLIEKDVIEKQPGAKNTKILVVLGN